MAKSRAVIVAALFTGGVGLVLAFILGLFAYMSATPPLHPNARDVISVIKSDPPPQWAGAVEQGRQIARAGITEQNLPGLSVAVGAAGEIVWAEGFGWADLEERVPVAPDMRFRTGGVSMALTSAAVGLLLEKGRLKLDEKIQTYVPEFPEKQWPVTLRQVMGHVAGIRGDAGDEENLSARCDRTVDGLQRFAERPLTSQPGTRFRYSTYGWIVVSAAVEAAAETRFFTFMRTQIFEPLRMDDTRVDTAEPIPRRATFYYPRFAADPRYGFQTAGERDYGCFAGAGAFLSTPSDLVRFGMAIDSGTLLRSETVRLLQTPQQLTSGEETGYGLGWDLETVSLTGERVRQVGHDSEFTFGSSTSLITFSERGLAVSVTTNTTFADTSSVALKIADAFAQHLKRAAPK